jgi:hypothetical protein
MICELSYRAAAPSRFDHPSDRYDRRGSFVWYHETEACASQEEAWAAAVAWARAWERRDHYGNFANAFGVVAAGGGWRGVVNYFHSNT